MKGSYVVLQIELDAIRNFLDHVNREAMDEIKSVLERNEAGAFEDFDDFDNALYSPVTRQEIAARAVYYELAPPRQLIRGAAQQQRHTFFWFKSKNSLTFARLRRINHA